MMVLVIRVELSEALLYHKRKYICFNNYFAECLLTRNLVLEFRIDEANQVEHISTSLYLD